MNANPRATGADLFPAAAGANRNVFYDNAGQPRSLAAIYQRFTDKLGDAAGGSPRPRTLRSQTQALDLDGATVVTGNNESATDALAWASNTIGRFGRGASDLAETVLRPTPDTARLAYLMLAGLGGR